MGMGYGAGYADVINDEFVKKTCPDEIKKLEAVFISHFQDWESFAREAQYGEFENDEIKKAYLALTQTFDNKTGLELCIGFHDKEDEGDRYDDVNGSYWHVGGVYQLTEASKRCEQEIERKLFVTFG